MYYATLTTGELAAVQPDVYVPFGAALAEDGTLPPGATMLDFIVRYSQARRAAAAAIERGRPIAADPALLQSPLSRPSKIWAAARNYPRAIQGSVEGSPRADAEEPTPDEILEMAFLKPPSAIVGPGTPVVIPPGASKIFPELELCVVIGTTARNLPPELALEAVFGYTILLDMTARGYGSGKNPVATRCVRKGFDTFAPLGPWIATADEIPAPQHLNIELRVNGEIQFSGSSDAMINSVAQLVSFFSRVSTLYPGDLIATGNPSPGAPGPLLKSGDVLLATIDGIGEMRTPIVSSSG